MAHSCPECGQCCYCGGDIDDCLFDFPDCVERCTHCPPEGVEDEGDPIPCGTYPLVEDTP
jgi:hypothetical protein